MQERRSRFARLSVELAFCSALVLAAVVFSMLSPHPLGHADEGYFLQHTKRVLAGQAVYRDFHEQYSPLGYYLMAVPWLLFGVNIKTTVFAMAAVHGGIAVLIYATARRLSVGPWLSVSGGLLHLALARPVWPMASGHWFGAFFLMLVFYVLARSPRARPPVNQAIAGVCAGVYIAVQYQKGIPIAVGLLALVCIEWWLERGRSGTPEVTLPRALLITGGSVAAVALILLLPHVVTAGLPQLIDQFFSQIGGYREINRASWGYVPPYLSDLEQSTSIPALEFMPLLILLGLVRSLLAWRRGDLPELRKLTLLCVYCSFTAAATLYRPDFVHLAYVAAPFFVFMAETAQWLVDRLGRALASPRATQGVAFAVFVAVLVAAAVHLSAFIEHRKERFRYSAMTAFGEVDFWSAKEAALIRAVLDGMKDLPTREIFCYPGCASMYVLADAENPTPYDLVFYPSIHSKKHVDEILRILEKRRVRYVVHLGMGVSRSDPVIRYVKRHYVRVKGKRGAKLPLYRRKAAD